MLDWINAARAASGIILAGVLLGGCQNISQTGAGFSTHGNLGNNLDSRYSRDTKTIFNNLRERNTKWFSKTSKTSAKEKSQKGKYDRLITKYARKEGVPISLARAVVRVESNYKPSARGAAGEVGLMQIKPSTARGMGYKGSTKALYNPETNIRWGMKYLGKAHKLGNGSTCGTILKYNAGHGATRMNKVSSRYCSKVKRIMS